MREFRNSMSEAVNDGHAPEPIVPQQAQLVAAPESLPSTPADAVVVDPAAPTHQDTTDVIEQPSPPPAS